MQNLTLSPQTARVSKYCRSLDDIRILIQEHYEMQQEAIRQSLMHAKIMGDLLYEAKGKLKHGQWSQWLKENFPQFAPTTVRNYMRISQNWEQLNKTTIIADLTVVKALNTLKKKQQKEKLQQPYASPVEDLRSILAEVDLKLNHFKSINWNSAVPERIPTIITTIQRTEANLSSLKQQIALQGSSK